MDSDVVKPSIFGRLVSYSVFGLLAILLAYGAIWVVFQVSPFVGIIVGLVLVAGTYFGATQIFGEIVSDAGGLLGGDLFMNWIALRLTPDQVESNWLLRLFFYVDRSRPLTGGEDKAL
jgi:hypothetical protein